MALTSTQRDTKHDVLRLAHNSLRESPNWQEYARALAKRASTSLGTPERAEIDKIVAYTEAAVGL